MGTRKLNYDAIIADLQSGMTRKEVAKKNNCHVWSVERVARLNGIELSREDTKLKRDMADAERYEKDVSKRWEDAVAPIRKVKDEREMRFNRANRLIINDLHKR